MTRVLAAAFVFVIHPIIHITIPFVDLFFHIAPLLILGVPKR